MTPLFADTFYFLALFGARDEAHDAAVAIATGTPRAMVTTNWVLVEVADACSPSAKRKHFLDLLRMLASSPDSTIICASGELFDRGVRLYAERMDKVWSLTDCISFEVMQEHGITEALTGDHYFERAGFKALLKP